MIIVYYLSVVLLLCLISNGLLVNECEKTPFWRLNICEIECEKCGNNGVCEQCANGFNLTQSKCVQNQQLIYHDSYFTSAQINSSVINQKMFKASSQYLVQNNIVRICQSNTYKFDMIGLFKQQTRLSYNLNFNTPVSQIQVKFNFLTLYNNTKLQIVLNGEQIHQVVFKNSPIDNIYQPTSNSINYLQIPALKQSSINVIVNKVDTGPIPFSESQFNKNNQLRLQISYITNTTNTSNFWAFSDFSVVGKKCQDCIPQRLKTLSNNVGIAIGITSAALIILILIMYGCVKLQEKKRLNSNQQTPTYDSFTQEDQKQQEKEEQKQNDLKIRQTMNKTLQNNKNSKKNKTT